jgi:hypothetical protein
VSATLHPRLSGMQCSFIRNKLQIAVAGMGAN